MLLPALWCGNITSADPNAFFLDETWAKVGERSCLKCHQEGGDAEDSRFILRNPLEHPREELKDVYDQNFKAFTKMGRMQKKGKSLLLQKATGGLEHEGKQVVKPESTAHRILTSFVQGDKAIDATDYTPPAYFSDIEMLDDLQLLRRVTLSLCGRLPTQPETNVVTTSGLDGLKQVVDQLMTEDAFYARLNEGFNDIILTMGHDDVPARILGYRNFGETRLWYQKKKFEHIEDPQKRKEAGWAFSRKYGENLLREPFELLEHIVRSERPFTEIVTADYLMVSPWTARAYGIYDDIKDQFKTPEDSNEFVSAKLPAMTLRDGVKPDQQSPTGWYPHAGWLTNFHYLQRYPTTDTNRNRLRARKIYDHFLGIDIMALAPQVSDAASVDAEYDNAVMEAAECVVCHRVIDPMAGLLQDYQNTSSNDGPYGPLKEGWFTDVFPPGFEGKRIPDPDLWRAPQWLGEIIAKDPRFAVAMVEHVYYILFGRKVLKAPEDIEDPMFTARRRAYLEQRWGIQEAAQTFIDANYNLKAAFQTLIASPFYRADGVSTTELHPQRSSELDDLGLIHLLTPEQLDRKIAAVFGQPWDRFSDQLKLLYGGIDSWEVTERLQDPSGAMGAIQRIFSNDVACKNVSKDFARPPSERRLFPQIELTVVPHATKEGDQQIRHAIVHLHERILGRRDTADDPEVEISFQLFADIIQDAHERGKYEPIESYYCKSSGQEGPRDPDPHYTLRAWRAVVTYLLRQQAFLYE